MNPTVEQLGIINDEDIIYGAKGAEYRWINLPFDLDWNEVKNYKIKKFVWRALKRITKPEHVQTMPTNKNWIALSVTNREKSFYLSQTLDNDFSAFRGNNSFFEDTKRQFRENIKYGIYSYGYIHDYMFTRTNIKYQTKGEYIFDQIDKTFSFLNKEKAKFIFTPDLIRILNDYLNGNIQYKIIDKHSMLVKIQRKNASANFIKVRTGANKMVKIESDSVVNTYRIDDYIYMDLVPENSSILKLHF